MNKKLSISDLQEALKNLPGWQLEEGEKALSNAYEFETFAQAFSFMTQVALFAEKMNHHPEWTNVDHKVQVKLSSHDCGGVSAKDVTFALYMDEVAFRFFNPYMSNHSDQVF